MNGKRVWLYHRAAGSEDSADALAAQKRRLEVYAWEHELEIVGCSEDVGGGRIPGGSGILEFEAAMERQEVDILLLHKLSCLGQDPGEVARYWRSLREHNVRLCTVTEGEVYLDMRALFLELFGNEKSGKDLSPL